MTDPYTAASDALLYAALLGLLACAWIFVRYASRRTARAAARAEHPATRAKKCGTTACAGVAYWIVTRHDGKRGRVCTDCYHEGNTFGIWR